MSKALGMYVQYKGVPYIIVKDDGKQVHLNSPDASRVKVNKSSVRGLHVPKAQKIRHKQAGYLVTRKGTIISLATGRVMKWDDTNGDRQMILIKAGL